MAAKTPDDLFLETLKDIRHAARPLLKALPRMAQGRSRRASPRPSSSTALQHRDETRIQVGRLQQIFEIPDKPVCARYRIARRGAGGRASRDCPLRHAEAMAPLPGLNDAAQLLGQAPAKEAGTDGALTKLAETGINRPVALDACLTAAAFSGAATLRP